MGSYSVSPKVRISDVGSAMALTVTGTFSESVLFPPLAHLSGKSRVLLSCE